MALAYQICIGPHARQEVSLAPGLRVLPLPSLGCGHEIAYIEKFLDNLGVRMAEDQSLQALGENFKPAAVIHYEWEAPLDTSVDALVHQAEPVLTRARHVMGLLNGEAYEPLTTIATHQTRPNEIVFPIKLPRVRGLYTNSGKLFTTEGPARSEAEILFHYFGIDERLERLATLYQTATLQEDPLYRIAQLYMCLVAIAAGLRRRRKGLKDSDSVRMATGYGYGEAFAIFQIEGRRSFALDHVGVARKVRDHVYHAGQLKPANLNAFRNGWELLDQKPALLSFALAADCLRLLYEWPVGNLAANAYWDRPFTEPIRQAAAEWPRWHFICEEHLDGACAAARIDDVAPDNSAVSAFLSSPILPGQRQPRIIFGEGRGQRLDGPPLGYDVEFGEPVPATQ